MRILISGMHGTVAPAIAMHLQQHGASVVAWDRSVVSPDDPQAIAAFFDAIQPAWLLHVATGSPIWAETLAQECCKRQIPMLFTSTVSVFSQQQPGPFAPSATPDATDDYGRYKIECEQRIQHAYPAVIIARLGWQIGEQMGGNTMLQFLAHNAAQQGAIQASRQWYPSCAFLPDTARAIHTLMHQARAGIYHLEGNPGLSFYQIACALRDLHQADWTIIPGDTPAHDGRMHDDRIALPPISQRLNRHDA